MELGGVQLISRHYMATTLSSGSASFHRDWHRAGAVTLCQTRNGGFLSMIGFQGGAFHWPSDVIGRADKQGVD